MVHILKEMKEYKLELMKDAYQISESKIKSLYKRMSLMHIEGIWKLSPQKKGNVDNGGDAIYH